MGKKNDNVPSREHCLINISIDQLEGRDIDISIYLYLYMCMLFVELARGEA
jgi:hypothetical protein